MLPVCVKAGCRYIVDVTCKAFVPFMADDFFVLFSALIWVSIVVKPSFQTM